MLRGPLSRPLSRLRGRVETLGSRAASGVCSLTFTPPMAPASRPLVLVLLMVSCVAAERLRADTVDDVVAAQMQRRGNPGVSIAIIDGDTVVNAKGYGYADLQSKSPVTTETLFQAGSVSNPVAAMGEPSVRHRMQHGQHPTMYPMFLRD